MVSTNMIKGVEGVQGLLASGAKMEGCTGMAVHSMQVSHPDARDHLNNIGKALKGRVGALNL